LPDSSSTPARVFLLISLLWDFIDKVRSLFCVSFAAIWCQYMPKFLCVRLIALSFGRRECDLSILMSRCQRLLLLKHSTLAPQAPFNGKGRPIWAFRRSGVWRLVAGYFPASFITETKLDAGRSYIFALHPHGICGIGAWVNIMTDGTAGFLAQHPWLDVSCVTVRANFLIPLWRDLVVLGFGLVDASKDSCRAVLSHGRSLAIVVGGAAESLDAHPGTLDLTLRKRRGFVAMALETGADLVPVLTFGETNLFAQAPNPRGSRLRRFQEGTIRRFGFAAPLFYGRGIIQPWFGLVAHREPLVTVFGAPLRVEKAIATPTAEQIDALHERYVAALMLLFERHRHALAPDCAKGLRIVA
ncbi:unnamed protein product, partial [Phaeothamnion confervicola]